MNRAIAQVLAIYTAVGMMCAILGGLISSMSGGMPWFSILKDGMSIELLVLLAFIASPFSLASLLILIPYSGKVARYISISAMSLCYIIGFSFDIYSDAQAPIAMLVIPIAAYIFLSFVTLISWLFYKVHEGLDIK